MHRVWLAIDLFEAEVDRCMQILIIAVEHAQSDTLKMYVLSFMKKYFFTISSPPSVFSFFLHCHQHLRFFSSFAVAVVSASTGAVFSEVSTTFFVV